MVSGQFAGTSRVDVLSVGHASPVAAIQTADGPAALLESGLVERLRSRGCDVRAVEIERAAGDALGAVAESFSIAAALAAEVRRSFGRRRVPIVLSSSCHTALGTVSGLPEGPRGVIWLDAHGDFNTPETSPSGLLDGMTLATITGRCWQRLRSTIPGYAPVPDDAVLLLGVRDLDGGEGSLLAESNIVAVPAGEVGERCDVLLRRLRERVDAVYVHLDLDVLDPLVGRANEYAVANGLSEQDLRTVLDAIRRTFAVRALALASYDPSVDAGGGVRDVALDAALDFVVGAANLA